MKRELLDFSVNEKKFLEIIRDARKVKKFHAVVRGTDDIFLTLDTQSVSLHLATFRMICFSYTLVFNGSRTHSLKLKTMTSQIIHKRSYGC